MTKNEKNKILKLVDKLSEKNYSEANHVLNDLVTEKLKTRVRTVTEEQNRK